MPRLGRHLRGSPFFLPQDAIFKNELPPSPLPSSTDFHFEGHTRGITSFSWFFLLHQPKNLRPNTNHKNKNPPHPNPPHVGTTGYGSFLKFLCVLGLFFQFARSGTGAPCHFFSRRWSSPQLCRFFFGDVRFFLKKPRSFFR